MTTKARTVADPLEDLMTVADLKKLTKLSEYTLREMTRKDQIPHVKIGRNIRYEPAKIRRWIDRQS